jgi:hypothetical protein
MRRTPVLVLLAALAAALLTIASTASARHAERPPLRATLAACGTGASADERFAIFTGSMPARKGTRRMAMRFDLYERVDGRDRYARLAAPAFGRWERSEPGRAGFVYTKRVERLREAAAYRAVVRFRWYDADGTAQRTLTRTTPPCRQPDRRADLEVESIGVVSGERSGEARYLVTVANAGLSAAGAFDVGLVAGGTEAVRSVAALAPGERTTIELAGPRCEGAETISATVDVRGAVDEADEGDNAYRKLCGAR